MASKKTYQKETLLLNLYCLLLERLAENIENRFVRKSILPMGEFMLKEKKQNEAKESLPILSSIINQIFLLPL